MRYLPVKEVATRLDVTPRRVQALIKQGRLKAVKVSGVWLITPEDLAALKILKSGRPKKV